jgi:hypothetical protein
MIKATRRPIELDRQCDAARNPGSQAKEQAKAEAVADTKHEGVRHRARKQPQRTVLPTQQVISKIQAAQHIKARAGNADARDCVMVHYFLSAKFSNFSPASLVAFPRNRYRPSRRPPNSACPSLRLGFCGMMIPPESWLSKPSSEAIQARQAMAQWDAPSSTLFLLIPRCSLAVVSGHNLTSLEPFSTMNYGGMRDAYRDSENRS